MTGPDAAAPATEPLRVGVLGAARITELALVEPARLLGTRIVAVAARDRGRATGDRTARQGWARAQYRPRARCLDRICCSRTIPS